MKVFVINLDRNRERLESVSGRLAERGVTFERFPAVDGRALDPAERRRCYSPVRTAFVRGHGLLSGELGCALSHLGVYRKMVADGLDIACVLEDDAFPEPDFVTALARLENELDVRRAQVVLLAPTSYHSEPSPSVPGLQRLENAMFTDAYVITRPAAEAILRTNFPVRCACDFWGYLRARAHFELFRLLPPVSHQDSTDFGTDVAGPKPAWVGTWRWRLWRAFGKAADWLLWKVTVK